MCEARQHEHSVGRDSGQKEKKVKSDRQSCQHPGDRGVAEEVEALRRLESDQPSWHPNASREESLSCRAETR